ncbi:MAG: hypothetical protein HY376_01315 [Candidatus Blackburnbacteria bacterium]|nr:hypothetical protein [Candidatus Blackburnbacteria bacterium]
MPPKAQINRSQLKKFYKNNNLSIYQIAPLFGVHPSTIAKRLHQYKIPLNPPSEKVKINKETLTALYLIEGLSTYKIATRYRCNVLTIRKKMKKYGISARPLKRVSVRFGVLRKLYHKKKYSLKKIGQLYNLSPASVLKKVRKAGIQTRKPWEGKFKYAYKPFTGTPIEKAYLIGFRLGDLGVRQRKNSKYVLVGSNTTILAQVSLIKNLFSKYSHIWIGKSGDRISTSLLLHPSFSFLVPKKDRIEPWILSRKSLTWAFIAGYTDAEGSIGVYSGRARFRIGSYDVGILRQIFEFFNKLGIRTTFNLEQLKGFVDRRGTKHNGDFWRVSVNEKTSLLRLFELLGTYLKHKKRISDLVRAQANVLQRQSGIIHA